MPEDPPKNVASNLAGGHFWARDNDDSLTLSLFPRLFLSIMPEPTKEQIQLVFKKLKQNRYNKVWHWLALRSRKVRLTHGHGWGLGVL